MSAPQSITIIRARSRRLAKLICADGTDKAYDSAKTYDLFDYPLPDIEALDTLLQHLLTRPTCAVVRGGIIDPTHTKGVRRLVHADPETGECPTLEERPRQWLALDVDNIQRPTGIEAVDLQGCALTAIAQLPIAFRNVACIVQASASHGIKPGVRLRLWFWLSRPVTGPELKRWLGAAPVDLSVFRPAQVIYTAAPIFEAPGADPLPSRMLRLAGDGPVVAAPSVYALAPPRRPQAKPMAPRDPSANTYATAALTNAVARVHRATEGRRHDTVLAQALGLSRFVSAGLLTAGEVQSALVHAGVHVGKTADEVSRIIAWTLALPGRPMEVAR